MQPSSHVSPPRNNAKNLLFSDEQNETYLDNNKIDSQQYSRKFRFMINPSHERFSKKHDAYQHGLYQQN